MFQAKIRGFARLAAGLLLVPGLTAFDVVVLPQFNQSYCARPPGRRFGEPKLQRTSPGNDEAGSRCFRSWRLRSSH